MLTAADASASGVPASRPANSAGEARFPLVLIGRDFWAPLLALLDQLVIERTIDRADRDRLVVTDSAEEAVDAIAALAIQRFGLTYGPRVRRWWLLGERA